MKRKLSQLVSFVRGFLMITACPKRYKAGVMIIMGAYSRFDSDPETAALCEKIARQMCPRDIGGICTVIQCQDNPSHVGESVITRPAAANPAAN